MIQTDFTFTVAGMPFELSSASDLATLRLQTRFSLFAGGTHADFAPVQLHWREGDPETVARGALVHDPGSIWRTFRRADGQEGYVVHIGYPLASDGKLRQAAVVTNATWEEIEIIEQPESGDWQSLLLSGVGELILRTRILFAEGLICHASGLDDNGRGLLFVGHAGAGKSTQALLWSEEPGVLPLNDDRVAVRLHTSGPVIYGTPWGGTADIACNHQAPLRAILLIEQAPENSLEPLTPGEAATLLAPRTFLPYFDAALQRLALDHLARLVAVAPAYRLRCRPEKAVIPLVRASL